MLADGCTRRQVGKQTGRQARRCAMGGGECSARLCGGNSWKMSATAKALYNIYLPGDSRFCRTLYTRSSPSSLHPLLPSLSVLYPSICVCFDLFSLTHPRALCNLSSPPPPVVLQSPPSSTLPRTFNLLLSSIVLPSSSIVPPSISPRGTTSLLPALALRDLHPELCFALLNIHVTSAITINGSPLAIMAGISKLEKDEMTIEVDPAVVSWQKANLLTFFPVRWILMIFCR